MMVTRSLNILDGEISFVSPSLEKYVFITSYLGKNKALVIPTREGARKVA